MVLHRPLEPAGLHRTRLQSTAPLFASKRIDRTGTYRGAYTYDMWPNIFSAALNITVGGRIMAEQKRPRSETSAPEWSRKIEAFRQSLKLSQVEFSQRLGVSPMSVSRWERGALSVPTSVYIKLGNLAGDPLCWYFWARAGLRSEDVMRVLPAARDRLHEGRMADVLLVDVGKHRTSQLTPSDFVAIPLLPVHAGAPGEKGDKEVDLEQVRPETMLVAPKDWCPHPDSTVCLRVKGNSMSPLILDGYIIAVDTFDVRREPLVGKIVLASNPEKGLLVSRLIRFDGADALLSDHREYESVSLATEANWRIIGIVLWWTGKAR
jgi:DNA-binding transcriptional regulator YiaG/SOS-response transcriptional repressor LexA